MTRVFRLVLSVLSLNMLVACDRNEDSSMVSSHVMGARSPREDAADLIRRVREKLAADKVDEAIAGVDALMEIRDRLSSEQQLEIDRLDAMLARDRKSAGIVGGR
jgi:hypothetical protein